VYNIEPQSIKRHSLLTPEEAMETRPVDQSIVQQFKALRKRQLLATIPIVLAFIILIGLGDNPEANIAGLPSNVLQGVAFVIIVGVLIFSFFNWRCPSCKKYLGKAFNPKFCTKCGAQLQ
jgi:hypothetical protein